MKKSFLFLFFISCFYSSKAQGPFHSAIETFYARGYLDVESYPKDNLQAALVDRAYEMEAILTMYKKTKDEKWLHLFVKHADKIINARDDMQVGRTPLVSYLGKTKATWLSSYYSNGFNYAWVYHTGLLTYSLAEFCFIISQNPSHFESVYARNPNGTFYTHQSFVQIAKELSIRLKETMDAHEEEWQSRTLPNGLIGGGYHLDCNKIAFDGFYDSFHRMAGSTIPLNMSCAFGKTFLYLYLASSDSNPNKNYFKERSVRIANTLRYNMTSESLRGSNSYIWRYFDSFDHPAKGAASNDCVRSLSPLSTYTGNTIEDWGHSIIEISFAYLCFQYSIPHSMDQPEICFDSLDMKKIAATFKNFYAGPMKYYDLIDRTGGITYSDYVFDFPHAISGLGHWLVYSEFDPDLYQIISEIYVKFALQKTLPSWPGFLGMVNAYIYQDKTIPIDFAEGAEASDWTAAVIGDFNHDGVKDMAAARNSDGQILISSWNFNATLNRNHFEISQTIALPSSSKWIDMALGNFDGEPGDEIACVRKNDRRIYVWRNEGDGKRVNMQLWKSFKLKNAKNWIGIAAGNMDAEDKSDELLLFSSSKGKIFLSEFDGINFKTMTQLTQPSKEKWDGFATGNFRHANKSDFILKRSSDSAVLLYELKDGRIQLISTYQAPFNLDGKGIASGDFDGDGLDELCIQSESEGDLIFLKSYANSFIYHDKISFVGMNHSIFLKNQVLASADLSNGASDCPMDEIVNFRNSDGWNYVYQLNLNSSCEGVSSKLSYVSTVDQVDPLFKQDFFDFGSNADFNSTMKNFNFEAKEDRKITFTIFNSMGQQVHNVISLARFGSENILSIDTSKFRPGIYLCRIDGESFTSSKFFSISK